MKHKRAERQFFKRMGENRNECGSRFDMRLVEGGVDRWVCVGGSGWGGGLFWASLPAIIHLSLGVSLINAAFLHLTSKVTGIVGTQPLPFAAAPKGGNGHHTRYPRGFFLSVFFCFSLFCFSLNSLCLSVCVSPWSALPLFTPFSILHPHPSLSPCCHFSVSLSLSIWLLLSFHHRSLIWNAIKSCNNVMCLKTLKREKGGNRPSRGYYRAPSEVQINTYTSHTHATASPPPSVHRHTAKVKADE